MIQVDYREYRCGLCGERNEVLVDPAEGSKQVFVEDCSICCRPNVLTVTIDQSLDAVTIDVELES